ncbi:hypothetical protein SAY86_006556 [Trapa natans]|uniref:Uncharacterized protein n=1 Tax=Trapa natans TaxID=22666 RepID=A0AAN7QXR0_TRANT|nr:hypothetical protein SAY86_006556 [Trapa natans]
MIHVMPSPAKDGPRSVRRAAPAILLSISALLSLLTTKACRASKKFRFQYRSYDKKCNLGYYHHEPPEEADSVMSPRASLRRRPNELLTSMSSKAIKLVLGRQKAAAGGRDEVEEDFGDGGVWQRAILMGDKCQPLDFSGVIYYDENGRKLNNLPMRSPRASLMRGHLI